MEFDVEMKTAIVASIRGRLVQRHDVRKRYLPEIVESDEHVLQHARQVEQLVRRQRCKTWVRCFRSHKHFVSVASEVWDEGDGGIVFSENTRACLLFGSDDVSEKHAASLVQVILTDASLSLDRFEDE